MRHITLLALVIGLSALTTFAQNGPRGPGGRRGPGGPGGLRLPVIAALDANTNNVIEAGEITNASTTLLKLDKDGDGKLSAAELQPQRPGGSGSQQPFPPRDGDKRPALPIMKALDSNSDGALDASEIANASTALKTLDTNGDGQLAMDELMPKPPEGFGGRDGGGRQENKQEFGSRVVLELAPGTELKSVLTNQNLTLARTVRSNLFILQAPNSASAIDAAEALGGQNRAVVSSPVMRRALKLHNAYALALNDSYFGNQWHLENRGSDANLAGPDLNVRAAQPTVRGGGITVAVADTGFQLDHPDLTNRDSPGPHLNFFQETSDGSPYSSTANHGTAVAGLIAAEADNSRGVAGVASQSNLASWVIFGTSFGSETTASDEQLMDMFQYLMRRNTSQVRQQKSAKRRIIFEPLA